MKNRVYYGDNLPILKTLPDASVNLIYIDPPFNTGKTQSRTAIKVKYPPLFFDLSTWNIHYYLLTCQYPTYKLQVNSLGGHHGNRTNPRYESEAVPMPLRTPVVPAMGG